MQIVKDVEPRGVPNAFVELLILIEVLAQVSCKSSSPRCNKKCREFVPLVTTLWSTRA